MLHDITASIASLEGITFADLHLHSKYSRATSPLMEVTALDFWARRKGLGLLGTGDFTHPQHLEECAVALEADAASGFYRLKDRESPVRFVFSAETSHIYKQNGKTRRVHMLMCASGLPSAREINRALASRGNVAADGRPIFGFSAKHLVKLVREIDPLALIIPAHIWTPWFSVLGEKSGFDSLAECFEEELAHVIAVETGLSSDPQMNWTVSELEGVAIVSNSDAHSPGRLGRECNAFSSLAGYTDLRSVLQRPTPDRFRFTVEFFPEEGKYHWPGHAACKVVLSPAHYLAAKKLCPICRKPLTAGVASRVAMLSDRPTGHLPPRAIPTVHLVPLEEIIADALSKGVNTKAVAGLWERLTSEGGTEFEVLLTMPETHLADLAGPNVARAILAARAGRVQPCPGYDGIYGKIKIAQDTASDPQTLPNASQLALI